MKNDNDQISFIPLLDFNDPIFIELDKRIRPLLDNITSSLDRELQIRTLLYINFNKYLTILFSRLDENIALQAMEKITETPITERLELIIGALNQPIDKIINNFIELFNRNA